MPSRVAVQTGRRPGGRPGFGEPPRRRGRRRRQERRVGLPDRRRGPGHSSRIEGRTPVGSEGRRKQKRPDGVSAPSAGRRSAGAGAWQRRAGASGSRGTPGPAGPGWSPVGAERGRSSPPPPAARGARRARGAHRHQALVLEQGQRPDEVLGVCEALLRLLGQGAQHDARSSAGTRPSGSLSAKSSGGRNRWPAM